MASNTEQERIAMRDVSCNEHCGIQQAAMRAALDLVPSYPDSKSLVVVDYGCSQGANSVEALEKVVSTLPDNAVARLYLEDTPFNDFGSLAKTIETKISTLASKDKGISVFPAMIPVGFYRQVMPDASVDLGLAWSSLNYLEAIPYVKLSLETSPAEFAAARHAAFSEAGARDLVKLLRLRAAEIREGGSFVAVVGGQGPADDSRPSTTGSLLLQSASIAMLIKGRLTREELGQMALFPSHERTPEEILTVLNDAEIKALWTVESLEQKLIEHPAWTTYQADLKAAGGNSAQKESAVRTYASAIANFLISAAGWFWVDELKKSRGAGWKDGDAFLEELTELAVQAGVEKFPDMKVEIWHHYVRLRRTGAK